jgi:hypothetical protein
MRTRALPRLAPILAGALAAACTDAPCDGGSCAPCTVTFTGNFAEQQTSPAACPALDLDPGGDQLLALDVPSSTLGADLTIAIDLGPRPTPGTFSPATVSSWRAIAARSIADGGCVYSAGDEAVPTGSFALTLTAVDAAAGTLHGALDVAQTVKALEGTDCGDGDEEQVHLDF